MGLFPIIEVNEADMAKKNNGAVASGLSGLDSMIGGFNCGELAIVGGRPAMGTTAFLNTIINNGIVEPEKKISALCVQPGLSVLEARTRLDCLRARVDLNSVASWCITNDELCRLKKADEQIFNAPTVHLCDWPAMKQLFRIRKEAIRVSKECELRVIAVDYLQSMIMAPCSEDAAKICAGLKGLAKRLNVAVILLSRVPRTVERRTDRIPRLSDLEVYGDIEKYADKILFIYREEYYTPTGENKGSAKIVIAKNKGGQTGSVDVSFMRSYLRFDNAPYRS